MKAVKVGLNNKSIEKAKEKLELVKKQLMGDAFIAFMDKCCQWIINRANSYLQATTIGQSVKDDIMANWIYDKSTNPIIITNTSDKAVYVEFGVGIVGQSSPHANAASKGWDYNIGNKINKTTNEWIFNVQNDADIDIQEAYIINKSEHLSIRTRGSPAVMYAYNAIVDARNEISGGGGVFAEYLIETIGKFWG